MTLFTNSTEGRARTLSILAIIVTAVLLVVLEMVRVFLLISTSHDDPSLISISNVVVGLFATAVASHVVTGIAKTGG